MEDFPEGPEAEEELIGEEEAEGEAEGEAAEGEANVDDIPIEGEDDGAVEAEEEKEVIDKLRPKRKAYG